MSDTKTSGNYHHVTVLKGEVSEWLQPAERRVIVDGTVGGGGHAEALLEQMGPDSRLIGIDRDEASVAAAQKRLERFGERAVVVQGHYRDIAKVLEAQGETNCDGVVLDLGFSSYHLEGSGRGFSFQKSEPLDMRYDVSDAGPTAADIINTFSEQELRELFWEYGEEKFSRVIADAIVKQRRAKSIQTTDELVHIVTSVAPRKQKTKFGRKTINPATRIFQALRIAVNRELDTLEESLRNAVAVLSSGGRIGVISFHSLEDRIVKRTFLELSKDCVCPPELPECRCDTEPQVEVVTRKPVVAGEDEVADNPRARSAKLRVAQKLTS